MVREVKLLAGAVLAALSWAAGESWPLSESESASWERCQGRSSCVSCTQSWKCAWSQDRRGDFKCGVRSREKSEPEQLVFEDTCPVDYGDSDSFLSNWMGELMPVLGDSPVLDLSLPGTHDTLTYDLSTTVSEGGIDELYRLAELLHNKTDVIPGKNFNCSSQTWQIIYQSFKLLALCRFH